MNTAIDPVQEYEDFMCSHAEQDSYVAPVIMNGYIQPSQIANLEMKADYLKRVDEEKFYDLKNFFMPMAIASMFMVGLVTTINNITSIF
jgi:hypothetical protein